MSSGDRHITIHSGFLNLIEPYDTYLADRGFNLRDHLLSRKAELVVLPGVRGREQMTAQRVHTAYQNYCKFTYSCCHLSEQFRE